MVSLLGFDPQPAVYVEKPMAAASGPFSFVYADRSLFKSSLGTRTRETTRSRWASHWNGFGRLLLYSFLLTC